MQGVFKIILFLNIVLLLSKVCTAQTFFSRLKKVNYVGFRTDTGISSHVIHYNYSGNRSGDLKSAIIKFDNSYTLSREFDYSSLDSTDYQEQSFDATNNRLLKFSKAKSKGKVTWGEEEKTDYTFDSKGNVIAMIVYHRTPPAATWDEIYKVTYTYIAPGIIDTTTSYKWVSGVYEAIEQTIYAYGTSYDTLSILFKRGATLINVTLKNNSYDPSGKIENEEWYSWNSLTSTWNKSIKRLYYYNAATKVDSVLYYHFDASEAKFLKDQRNIYTMDDSENVIKREYQGWNKIDENYLTFNLYYIDFDKKNNPVKELFLNLISSKLDTSNRRKMTYNGYNQILSYTNEEYRAGVWTTGYGEDKIRYEYEEFELRFKEQKWPNSSLNLFPVPSDDKLEIKLSLPATQGFTVLIYDLMGRVWDQWDVQSAMNYHEVISVKQFPAGYYFLKIQGVDEVNIVRRFAVSN